MSKARRRIRNRNTNTGKLSIVVIVIALLIIMSFQVFRLKARDNELMAKEKAAQEAYELETQRSSDIEELEKHVNSKSFIVEMAHKLGLVVKDEILFKKDGE